MKMKEDLASRQFDDCFFFLSFGWIEIERDSLGIYVWIDLGDGRILRYAHGVMESHKIWIEEEENDPPMKSKEDQKSRYSGRFLDHNLPESRIYTNFWVEKLPFPLISPASKPVFGRFRFDLFPKICQTYQKNGGE